MFKRQSFSRRELKTITNDGCTCLRSYNDYNIIVIIIVITGHTDEGKYIFDNKSKICNYLRSNYLLHFTQLSVLVAVLKSATPQVSDFKTPS